VTHLFKEYPAPWSKEGRREGVSEGGREKRTKRGEVIKRRTERRKKA
jgi:hypothetical protein